MIWYTYHLIYSPSAGFLSPPALTVPLALAPVCGLCITGHDIVTVRGALFCESHGIENALLRQSSDGEGRCVSNELIYRGA